MHSHPPKKGSLDIIVSKKSEINNKNSLAYYLECVGIESYTKDLIWAAIVKAARKKELSLHPDKNPGADEKFKEIKPALDILQVLYNERNNIPALIDCLLYKITPQEQNQFLKDHFSSDEDKDKLDKIYRHLVTHIRKLQEIEWILDSGIQSRNLIINNLTMQKEQLENFPNHQQQIQQITAYKEQIAAYTGKLNYYKDHLTNIRGTEKPYRMGTITPYLYFKENIKNNYLFMTNHPTDSLTFIKMSDLSIDFRLLGDDEKTGFLICFANLSPEQQDEILRIQANDFQNIACLRRDTYNHPFLQEKIKKFIPQAYIYQSGFYEIKDKNPGYDIDELRDNDKDAFFMELMYLDDIEIKKIVRKQQSLLNAAKVDFNIIFYHLNILQQRYTQYHQHFYKLRALFNQPPHQSFINALIAGEILEAKEILSENPGLKFTPLISTLKCLANTHVFGQARQNLINYAIELINEEGIDFSIQDHEGDTALHVALQCGNDSEQLTLAILHKIFSSNIKINDKINKLTELSAIKNNKKETPKLVDKNKLIGKFTQKYVENEARKEAELKKTENINAQNRINTLCEQELKNSIELTKQSIEESISRLSNIASLINKYYKDFPENKNTNQFTLFHQIKANLLNQYQNFFSLHSKLADRISTLYININNDSQKQTSELVNLFKESEEVKTDWKKQRVSYQNACEWEEDIYINKLSYLDELTKSDINFNTFSPFNYSAEEIEVYISSFNSKDTLTNNIAKANQDNLLSYRKELDAIRQSWNKGEAKALRDHTGSTLIEKLDTDLNLLKTYETLLPKDTYDRLFDNYHKEIITLKNEINAIIAPAQKITKLHAQWLSEIKNTIHAINACSSIDDFTALEFNLLATMNSTEKFTNAVLNLLGTEEKNRAIEKDIVNDLYINSFLKQLNNSYQTAKTKIVNNYLNDLKNIKESPELENLLDLKELHKLNKLLEYITNTSNILKDVVPQNIKEYLSNSIDQLKEILAIFSKTNFIPTFRQKNYSAAHENYNKLNQFLNNIQNSYFEPNNAAVNDLKNNVEKILPELTSYSQEVDDKNQLLLYSTLDSAVTTIYKNIEDYIFNKWFTDKKLDAPTDASDLQYINEVHHIVKANKTFIQELSALLDEYPNIKSLDLLRLFKPQEAKGKFDHIKNKITTAKNKVADLLIKQEIERFERETNQFTAKFEPIIKSLNENLASLLNDQKNLNFDKRFFDAYLKHFQEQSKKIDEQIKSLDKMMIQEQPTLNLEELNKIIDSKTVEDKISLTRAKCMQKINELYRLKGDIACNREAVDHNHQAIKHYGKLIQAYREANNTYIENIQNKIDKAKQSYQDNKQAIYDNILEHSKTLPKSHEPIEFTDFEQLSLAYEKEKALIKKEITIRQYMLLGEYNLVENSLEHIKELQNIQTAAQSTKINIPLFNKLNNIIESDFSKNLDTRLKNELDTLGKSRKDILDNLGKEIKEEKNNHGYFTNDVKTSKSIIDNLSLLYNSYALAKNELNSIIKDIKNNPKIIEDINNNLDDSFKKNIIITLDEFQEIITLIEAKINKNPLYIQKKENIDELYTQKYVNMISAYHEHNQLVMAALDDYEKDLIKENKKLLKIMNHTLKMIGNLNDELNTMKLDLGKNAELYDLKKHKLAYYEKWLDKLYETQQVILNKMNDKYEYEQLVNKHDNFCLTKLNKATGQVQNDEVTCLKNKNTYKYVDGEKFLAIKKKITTCSYFTKFKSYNSPHPIKQDLKNDYLKKIGGAQNLEELYDAIYENPSKKDNMGNDVSLNEYYKGKWPETIFENSKSAGYMANLQTKIEDILESFKWQSAYSKVKKNQF